MAKPKQAQSFLDRATEAFRDKFPKVKPTQARLAKIAGVSQPAVFEWSLPDRAPQHPNVLRLAHELNVCVEWLYTGRGPKTPPATDAGELAEMLQSLPPDLRDHAAKFVQFISTTTKM